MDVRWRKWIMSLLLLNLYINYVYNLYTIPFKNKKIMNMTNNLAIYTNSASKNSFYDIKFKCYTDNNESSDASINTKKKIPEHENHSFYMYYSYATSCCVRKHRNIVDDNKDTQKCVVRVSCSQNSDDTTFGIAYQLATNNDTILNETCPIGLNTNERIEKKEKFLIVNKDNGDIFLKIELKPFENLYTQDPNFTIELNIKLETSDGGTLMLVDYMIYKFHICLCCLYSIIVLTGAVYLIYLKRTTNKFHYILGVSLLSGLLASFFYISVYQRLNMDVSHLDELKSVLVIAAILSSVRRIAIDGAVLLITTGFSILPYHNIYLKNPLIIFFIYTLLFVSLTLYTHVALYATISNYVIYFLNNMFTTTLYMLCFLFLRNTLHVITKKRSPQLDCIGLFYKRFSYIILMLILVILLFTFNQFISLVKINSCASPYQLVFDEVFWMLHSLFCNISVFFMIILHPNVHNDIYGSLNLNYQQLPNDDTQSATKMPISSANIQIQRNNRELRDAFTLFDEEEEQIFNTTNDSIVRLHKME